MSENTFGVLAGMLMSLAFAFVPGLKGWYEKLSSQQKQLFMLGALALIVGGKFGLGCLGKDASFACTADGGWLALEAFVYSAIANAGTYKATNYLAKPTGAAKADLG
jgi:hypothetical protein